MLVQRGQDGYYLLDLVQADKGLDGQIVESVVSLAIVCQFLYIVTVNSLPMSEEAVMMGRTFATVCGVC